MFSINQQIVFFFFIIKNETMNFTHQRILSCKNTETNTKLYKD